MLDKKDAQWWIAEVQKHPESASDLVRILADRLAFLDKQNEELRGELIALRRKQLGVSPSADVTAMRERIQQLEVALRQSRSGQRIIVYARDRVEINTGLDVAQKEGLGREMPGDIALLLCNALANLLIVTDNSQVFSLAYNDLPTADDSPTMLGNPNNVASILDQAALERSRFLALLSGNGYVYSLIVGKVAQAAKRQEKLLRNLIPGDPIVAAVPSYNADLFAVSEKGRWIRFPEKVVAGTGSLVMELPKGDRLVGLTPLVTDSDLLLLTTDGKLFLRLSTDFKVRRPGTSAGMVLRGQSVFGVSSAPEITILTRLGKLLTVRAAELPFKASTDMGIPLPGLEPGDSVLTFTS